ncbi:MAG: transposase [Clostridiaceae bacterium]|nr:transposase [Clostridiaceae bacterium]
MYYQYYSTWKQHIQQFFQIFSKPGAEIFFQMTIGWVLCTTRRTVTGIFSFVDPLEKRSHDAYHRFFPDGRWLLGSMWKLLAEILVQRFCPKGIITLSMDDTLFHHSGRKVSGAGYWRDAVRSTHTKVVHAWGLNLLATALQIQTPWGGEPLALPINMRLHRKKEDTLIELATNSIKEICQWFPQRHIRLVADGFFATLSGYELGSVTIISRIRRDATLYELPPKGKSKKRGRPRLRGKKLAKLGKIAEKVKDWRKVKFCQRGKEVKKLVYSFVAIWYSVTHKPVRIVICRDPEGKEKDDYFFTTDINMQPQEVLACYADRWAIEDTFKNVKQLLGAQQPQTYKGQGPERAAGFGLWLYSMVWLRYLTKKPDEQIFFVRPWYQHKTTPSFADAVADLRRELWIERIKYMFGNSAVHDEKFKFLLEALASAA